MTRDEVKARLLAEAEKASDELLAAKSPAGTTSLDEIERLALKGGAQFEASVLNAFGREELAVDEKVEQICEQCGSRMQRRGTHSRQVMTEAGATSLERTYYVCPGCGASVFPPG